MGSFVSITIPSLNSDGEPINPVRRMTHMQLVKAKFCTMFGGYTSYEAEGGFIGKDAKRVDESVTVITAYGSDLDVDKYMQALFDMSKFLGDSLQQSAVALTINGVMHLV